MSHLEDLVIGRIDGVRARGERILPNGTQLISPAPEIAPQAWHYVLFAPLQAAAIEDMEKELGQSFPFALKEFFEIWNGIKLFGYEMQVWGKRKSYVRVGDEAWQPFDLVALNRHLERPKGSPKTVIFIGSVSDHWIFVDISTSGNGRIGRTEREFFEPDKYWPDFNTWFKQTFELFWIERELRK